jgi:hypothetical protein
MFTLGSHTTNWEFETTFCIGFSSTGCGQFHFVNIRKNFSTIVAAAAFG